MRSKDFKEFVALLNANGVEYLVVGGYAMAWPQRQTLEHDGLILQLISLDDLKAHKRASGRPRDRDDLEQLP